VLLDEVESEGKADEVLALCEDTPVDVVVVVDASWEVVVVGSSASTPLEHTRRREARTSQCF